MRCQALIHKLPGLSSPRLPDLAALPALGRRLRERFVVAGR
ncbi:MAG: hypothetical protein P9F75_17135 [Candidatus Contendobacter sp.]|nr:hypothetical protein [Candidatus Contendobacter sp.]